MDDFLRSLASFPPSFLHTGLKSGLTGLPNSFFPPNGRPRTTSLFWRQEREKEVEPELLDKPSFSTEVWLGRRVPSETQAGPPSTPFIDFGFTPVAVLSVGLGRQETVGRLWRERGERRGEGRRREIALFANSSERRVACHSLHGRD